MGRAQRVFVTGGAGYIGAAMIPELLERGYRVRVFDKLYFGDAALAPVKDKIEIIQGDLRDLDPAALADCDAVVHLAGLSNDPTANFNPTANYKINTVATQVLAEACKSKGIRRFTFASTASIYDMGLDAEDVLKDEVSPVNPVAPYSTSNYECERILLHMADETFSPVCLRQGTVYGFSPRMRFDLVVNTFFKDALTKGELTVHNGGEMWRPLVDVTDVGRAHIACLEAPVERTAGRVYNVIFRNYRILELAHYVADCLRGRRDVRINVQYSAASNRSYRVSGDRIKRAIGFEPTISVQDALSRMVEVYASDQNPASMLDPRHYNIQWMTMLHEAEQMIRRTGPIF